MSETEPTSTGTSTAGQQSDHAARRAALVAAARERVQGMVDTVKARGGDVTDALELLLAGSGRVSDRPESVSRLGASLRALWAEDLADKAKKCGVRSLLRHDRRFSELVVREMAEPGSTGDASARRAADLFERSLADMARELDTCGALIGSLRGYVPHNHDSLKIRRVGEKLWVRRVAQWIDAERTFPGLAAKAIPAALSGVFQALITGERPTYRHGDARRGCLLYFNSAHSAVEYSRRFTTGGIARGMFRVLDRFARRAALMRVFGPDPEAMIREFLEREARFLPLGDAVRERILTVSRCRRALAGESGTPENLTAARVMAEKRALGNMIRLGNAFVPDFLNMVGKLVLKPSPDDTVWLEYWGIRLKKRLDCLPALERRELARQLDVYCMALLGEVYSAFDVTDVRSGDMTRWMNAWYALCDRAHWEEPFRAASAVYLSNRLARLAVTGGKDADEHLTSVLRRNRLLGRMDLLQKMVEMVEGEPYIFPENAFRLTDADLEAHLPEAVRSREARLSPRQREAARSAARSRLRETLARDLADYFAAEIGCASSDRAVRSRACLYSMGRPLPLTAEMRRFSKKLGRLPFSWWDRRISDIPPASYYGICSGMSWKLHADDMPGCIHFCAAAVVIGWISLMVRAIVAGRDEPVKWPEPIAPALAAIRHSGAFGVLGHLYLGMARRFNRQRRFIAVATRALADSMSARLVRGEFQDDGVAAVSRVLNPVSTNFRNTRDVLELLLCCHVRHFTAVDTFGERRQKELEAFFEQYF